MKIFNGSEGYKNLVMWSDVQNFINTIGTWFDGVDSQ